MSGLAAAERLGADYPFGFDPLAADQVGGRFWSGRKGRAACLAGCAAVSKGKGREMAV
jgi:hypothetical protein